MGTVFQVDRTAVSEVDDRFGADIPIVHRLEWIRDCRRRDRDTEHVPVQELEKYFRKVTVKAFSALLMNILRNDS